MPQDTEVSVVLKKKIEKWVKDIYSVKTELPKPIPLAQEYITAIDLYDFAGSSIVANCASFYQPNPVNQALVTI